MGKRCKLPKFYDVRIDAFREATQADLDNYMQLNAAFGTLYSLQQKLAQAALEIGQGKRKPGTVKLLIDGVEAHW